MKKGKTKKLNFTTLARQTLASALSLSMIFSANVMTFAAGDAKEAVATGSVVDFSKSGVVASTGNAATFNGTEVTFGTTAGVELADVHGVEITNPYVGNKELTSETVAQALQKTGGNLNVFVYRCTSNAYGRVDDKTNGPQTDRFYVAPYTSVEDAVKAASDSAGGIEIVEKLEDLTYATREAVGDLTASDEAIGAFDANNSDTYIASCSAVVKGQTKKKNCYQIPYATAEGGSIWINQDKRVLVSEPTGSSVDALEYEIVKETYVNSMVNWDPSYNNIKLMNLAQITGEGTSGTALNFIYPTWEKGVSISAWVKASSKDAAPIFTFMDKSLGFKSGKGYGGLSLMTDGTFVYSPGSWGQGNNEIKGGRYQVTYGEGAVPAKNVGQWVLVTVNFKNDGAEVYYNGVKSKVTSATIGNNSSGMKYFNHSYPVIEKQTLQEGLVERAKQGAYTQKLLKYFVGESRIKLASKEKMIAAGLTEAQYYDGFTPGYDSTDDKATSLMQYITRDTTKLYIGGATHADSKKNSGTACMLGYFGSQNDACIGMSIKDITFNNTLKTADEITAEFGEATAIKTASDAAIETTDASALASYDFKLDDEEKAEGVTNLNGDVNGAAYSKDDKNNTVIKLGGGVDGETPKGVELNNPFVKNVNVKENIADALAKTGLTLNAWTYLYDANTAADKTDDYYRVAKKTNKVEAGVEYASQQDSLHEEFNRNQVWAYAENTQATKAIVAKSTTSGDATVIVTEDAAQGVTMSVANVVLANAQAANNNNEGTYANLQNLKKGYINQKTITTDNIIKWSDGDIESVEACVKANKLGQTFDEKYPMYAKSANPASTAEQYSYPYPTWTKGVTLGVWVKAATDAAVNVFEFTDNIATLNFKADGTVIFKATSSDNGAKNTYQAKFDGATPAKSVGEWVYVSLVIKNDNIDVYYNGVKAEKTMKKTQKEASYFNYGTGYAEADTAARIKTVVEESGYQDVLKGFGNSTDYSDFSKYNMRNADNAAGVKDIMTFLTSADTKLYLGGSSAQAPYSETNADMEIGTLNFYDVLSNDTMVAKQFADAKSIRETGEPGNVTDTPVNPTDTPVNPTDTPVNPTDTPVNPTDTPVNPTDTPINPTDTPINPTDTPINPTDTPINPTDKPVEPTGLAGDADCDNRVDLKDATIALRLAVGIQTEITEQGRKNIDYNNDNNIDLNDATYTLKAAVGIAFTPPEKK